MIRSFFRKTLFDYDANSKEILNSYHEWVNIEKFDDSFVHVFAVIIIYLFCSKFNADNVTNLICFLKKKIFLQSVIDALS